MSFSGQGFKAQVWKALEIFPPSLVLLGAGWTQPCAPLWKRGEKLEFPTGMMFTSRFRKVKGENPLGCYLQCHRAEGMDIECPGCWLLCDPKGGTCCQKEVFLSAGGCSDLPLFSLGLSSQVWIWTSASWSPSHQLPLCTGVLLLYNPHADVSQIFLISNLSFSLVPRCSS